MIMLLIQKPHNQDDFILVQDYKLNFALQLNGYHPKYFYNKIFYYVISKDIKDFINSYKVKHVSEV